MTINAFEAERVFGDMANDMGWMNFGPALSGCVPLLQEAFMDNFRMRQGPDGPWAPRKDTKPHPLLVKTGRMLASVTSSHTRDNSTLVTRNSVTMTTDTPYAGYHEFGTSRMPQRRFMWVNDEHLARIEEHLADACFVILF